MKSSRDFHTKELVNKKSLNYIHPEDREKTRHNAIKALKRERTDPYEYRFIKKNKEVMWVLEMVASITYQGKRAVLGSFMDITERKVMEKSLLKSEEKYRSILENIEEGYAELDLKGNLLFFNDALCRIHGYTRDEVMKIGNYRAVMDKANAKKMFYYYNKVYTTGESQKEVEYEIITKSGKRRYIETSIAPMKDSSGRVFAFRGGDRQK